MFKYYLLAFLALLFAALLIVAPLLGLALEASNKLIAAF